MKKDQIRLKLEATAQCRCAVFRRINFVFLILQERLPLFASRRSNVHKQDSWIHLSLDTNSKYSLVRGWICLDSPNPVFRRVRSEERRVGKECRSRWSPYH